MDKANILIVDDEPINIELIADMLNDKYAIKVATNGKKALDIINKRKPDLLLLDINMPVMDGYELAGILKKDPITKNLPFIFLTSRDDNESIVKGFELGAVDYITKPFNRFELEVRVKNHIDMYLLQKDLNEQKIFIQTILDTQPNLILIKDKEKGLYANKTFLDFFGCKNVQEFQDKYESLSSTFLHNDIYFHEGKIKDGRNWIDHILEMREEERIVSIVSQSLFVIKAFNISAVKYNNSEFIITLTDISETILRQIQLEQKTIHDKLTGAYNREYFDINHKMCMKEANKTNKKLGFAILDIDHFKSVNDTYGHDVGDKTLMHFVSTIKKNSRENDKLIRWGGEEFIIILYVESLENLRKAAENYRTVIETQEFEEVGKITCSIGGTLYRDGEDINDTLKRIDEQLYIAKASGRNQVKVI